MNDLERGLVYTILRNKHLKFKINSLTSFYHKKNKKDLTYSQVRKTVFDMLAEGMLYMDTEYVLGVSESV